MRRWQAVVGVTAALVIAAAVVAGTSLGSGHVAKGPTKLTLWVGWSARELSVFTKVVNEYDKAHPDITVSVVGGINDNKIVAAIRAGNAPDVVSSFNSYNVGNYCGSGGWIDLAPLMKQDNISASTFPAATQYYTQYNGVRCALPLLADDYGLYYNKPLFAKAGITSPPKTISELTADAKKLTVRNADGSLKQIGIDPFIGFYENVPERWVGGVRRQVAGCEGQRDPRHRPGVGEVGQVAEVARRLVRVQQPGQVPGGSRRRVLGLERLREGQGRHEPRRRVARLVHCGRAIRSCSTGRRRSPSTTPSRRSTAPATSTARSSASRRTATTATRPGRSSST